MIQLLRFWRKRRLKKIFYEFFEHRKDVLEGEIYGYFKKKGLGQEKIAPLIRDAEVCGIIIPKLDLEDPETKERVLIWRRAGRI